MNLTFQRSAPGASPSRLGSLFLLSVRRIAVVAAALGLACLARAQSILPDATVGQAYSFQVVTNPPQPSGTVYTANGLPQGLSVDPSSGVVSGTTSTVGLFKGTLFLTQNADVKTFLFQVTVDPAAGASTITSNGSAFGTVGTPFTYQLTGSNSPSSFNVALLPPGLSASGGVISGTPTTAGLYFTSVSANNGSGQGAILVLMFTISPQGPIPADTGPLVVSVQPGASFSYTMAFSNSPTSYADSGLPAGLTLNTATGVISGVPTAPGVYTVPISATNGFGTSLPLNLSLTVGSFASITSPSTVAASVGSLFTFSVTSNNNPTAYTLSGLPAGLSFNTATGFISGTPTAAGIYTMTATATNALGAGPASTVTLTVTDPTAGAPGNTAPSVLVQPAPQTAVLGSTATFSASAVGTGVLSYQWSLNGVPISGQDSPTLTLAFVDAHDAGNYTLTVTSPYGTAVSAPASLTVLSLLIPPAITADPVKATVSAGSPVSFTVGASGSEPLSFQWMLNGNPVSGGTQATLTLANASLADAGTYTAVVSNPSGSSVSAGAVLTVAAAPFAPIFQFQPSAVTVNAGGSAALLVGVVGTPPLTYQWSKGGVAIPGATTANLDFPTVAASDAGTYSVVISNPVGSVTSTSAVLTVNPAGGPPVPVSIVVQPAPASVPEGGATTFFVAANGDSSITYQWRKNQQAIPGATSSSFTVSDVHASDAGTYDVEVANAFSATISFPTPLVVTPVAFPSMLSNVSVRGFSGTGGQALIVGFVVAGTGTESALVRAVGPTLSDFGVTGLLADPSLVIDSSSGVSVASNDNWAGTSSLSAAFVQTGAFPLPPASLDAAVLVDLQPGAYTAPVSGAAGGSGIVLLEAYDADTAPSPTAHFVNVSARGVAGAGANVLTVGFVIAGGSSETVLIRGIGPTLATFGVSGALTDPQLTVLDSRGNVVGQNIGWGGSAALQAAFQSVSAFSLPTTSKDSAVLLTLPPGAYTAEVNGVGGASGIGLVELYQMP